MAVDPFTGQFTSVFVQGARGGGMPDPNIQRRRDNAPGTVLSRGIGRGIDTIQRNLGSTVEGVGNVTGLEALAAAGARSVARNQAEIDASRAMENDNVATLIGSLFAENAPQTAASVGLPAAGAALGSVVPGVGTAIGLGLGTAASALFNYGQLAGENREAQRAELERQGIDPSQIDEAAAFGTAIPQAGLETLAGRLQLRLAQRARSEASTLFSREGAREVAGAATRGAGIESATEVGQQAGTRLQAGQDLTSQEAIQDLALAGLAGAIVGGTISGGATMASIATKPKDTITAEVDETLGRNLIAPPEQRLALPAPDPSTTVTPPPGQPSGEPIAAPTPGASLTAAPAGPLGLPAPATGPGTDLLGASEEAAPVRPFATVADTELAAMMRAAQIAAANGNVSPQNDQSIRLLRQEADIRGLEVTPQALDTGALFEGQTMQQLNLAVRRVNALERRGATVTPADVQLRDLAQKEITRRRTAQTTAEAVQTTMLGSGRELRRVTSDEQAEVMQQARELGLPAGSRFEKQTKARTMEELYDEVADLVAGAEKGTLSRADQKAFEKTTWQLAQGMGFDEEATASRITELERTRDSIALPSRAEAQTTEGQQAFAEAMAARQAADQKITRLRGLQQNVAAAEERRSVRVDQSAAQEAIVGDAADARSLREEFDAISTITQRGVDLSATGEIGSLGAGLVEAARRAQRQQEFDQARGQVQDQQFGEMSAALRAQEMQPTEIVGQTKQGTSTTVTFSEGPPVTFERRDGGVYVGDQFVGRDAAAAVNTVREARDRERGIMLKARGPLTETESSGLAPRGSRVRAQQVKQAIAAAMEGWDAPYKVYVVSNVDQLPADVRSRVTSTEVAGFMTEDGTVGIVADQIDSAADAVAVMYHEVLGHAGMLKSFGQERGKVIMDMYENSPALREMYLEWRYAVGPEALNYYARAPLWARIEEAIATKAESGPIRATFLQRMAKIAANFARRLGLKVKISRAELTAILAEAHRRAMAGEAADIGKRPAPAEVPVKPMPSPAQTLEAAQTYGDANTANTMLRLAVQATNGLPDTPKGNATAIGRIIEIAEQGARRVRKRISTDGLGSLRVGALYFQSLGHITQSYGDMFKMTTSDGQRTNALEHFAEALNMRNVVHQVYSRIGKDPLSRMASLPEKVQEDIRELMGATFLRVDPRKPLEAHDHLTAQEKADIRKDYNKTRAAWMRVGRSKKARKVYDDMVAVNEANYFQQHTLDLYDAVRLVPEVRANISAARRNPIKRFTEAHEKQNDPRQIREFWRKELEQMLEQTRAFVGAYGTERVDLPNAARVETLVANIEAQVEKTDQQIKQMKEYPYFHIGRFGNFSAAFRLKSIKNADGKVVADPRAVKAASAALEALGYENIAITENANGASVFIRVDNRSAADDITEMAKQLQRQGFVQDVKDPQYLEAIEFLPETSRSLLQSLIDEIEMANQEVSGDDQKTIEAKRAYKKRVISDLKSAFFNRLPDRSIEKVMAQREFRSGFDKDMVRAYAQRQQIAALSSGSRLAGDMIGEAFSGMTDALRARDNPSRWAMIAVAEEMRRRETDKPDTAISEFMNGFRAVNHNYFLALNPGYWLTQITQIGTNTWPELVKMGASYREALSTLTGAATPAAKIVKAAMQQAKEQGFLEYGADPSITSDVLARVELSPDPVEDKAIKDFVMYMANTGTIDLGSQARSLGRAAEAGGEGRFDTTMRWASSGSYYLEMTTRLTGALAAREIAKKQGKGEQEQRQMGRTVVNESFFNYTEGNRARAFGRDGIVREATPLATAFLTFQFLMVEKYFREFGTALGANRNTPEGKAARRWLGAHLAVMGTLAGGLGLPFVTVIARVIDELADWLGDDEEPYQVKIAYRNFLADTFGEDVGEAMARGLPRALGFDISSRVGAADIIPFSQLIADRRSVEDAFGAMAERSYGSALGMSTDIAQGVTQMLNGNFFEGARQALPVALKNPLNAIKLGTDGFTDSRNTLLPMDPSTSDIVYQFLGLTPAQRAEYSEANFAQAIRRGEITRRSTALRKRMQVAVGSNDRDAIREILGEMREFDQGVDPSFRILPNLMRSVNQSQNRQQLARELGAPLGVRQNDLTGQEITGFANF